VITLNIGQFALNIFFGAPNIGNLIGQITAVIREFYTFLAIIIARKRPELNREQPICCHTPQGRQMRRGVAVNRSDRNIAYEIDLGGCGALIDK